MNVISQKHELKIEMSKCSKLVANKCGEYLKSATNDGNKTLAGVTVTDELTGDKWTVDSLAPGASEEFEAEYTVTEADVEAGQVVNVATATADGVDPDDVDPGTDPEPTVKPVPRLRVTKQIVSTPANGNSYGTGETILYNIIITNIGDVDLNNVTVTDQLNGATGTISFNDTDGGTLENGTITFETLPVGKTGTITAGYTVLAVDAGASISNTATATAPVPDGDDPTDSDTTPEVSVTSAPTPIPTPTPAPAPTPDPDPVPATTSTPTPEPTPAGPYAPTGRTNPNPTPEPTPEPTPTPNPPEVINPEPAPLANNGVWALVNLLSAIATAVISGVKLLGLFGKSHEDDDENEDENGTEDGMTRAAAPKPVAYGAEQPEDEGDEAEIRRHRIMRLASLASALASVVTFLLTEDMSNPMTFVDRWTLLMLIYLLVQGVLAFISRKTKKDAEDEEPEDTTEATA